MRHKMNHPKAPRPQPQQERYPQGCPIDGHQGYGCTCNPVSGPRR